MTLDMAAARTLIDSYQPVDDVSAYYKQQFLALIDSTPHAASRSWLSPGHLTAQAVIYNPALKALAACHHKKLNIDVFPGGHIEPEDTDLIAAARREAAEECGLTDLTLAQETPFDLDIHTIPARKDEPDKLHFDVRFLFTTTQTELLLSDESNSVYWLPISELRQRLPMGVSNSRMIRQLEALYL